MELDPNLAATIMALMFLAVIAPMLIAMKNFAKKSRKDRAEG